MASKKVPAKKVAKKTPVKPVPVAVHAMKSFTLFIVDERFGAQAKKKLSIPAKAELKEILTNEMPGGFGVRNNTAASRFSNIHLHWDGLKNTAGELLSTKSWVVRRMKLLESAGWEVTYPA